MIKARGPIGPYNQDHIIFGLSRENIERLMDNQPIRFDGEEVNLPGVMFVIVGGQENADIIEDLRSIGFGKTPAVTKDWQTSE